MWTLDHFPPSFCPFHPPKQGTHPPPHCFSSLQAVSSGFFLFFFFRKAALLQTQSPFPPLAGGTGKADEFPSEPPPLSPRCLRPLVLAWAPSTSLEVQGEGCTRFPRRQCVPRQRFPNPPESCGSRIPYRRPFLLRGGFASNYSLPVLLENVYVPPPPSTLRFRPFVRTAAPFWPKRCDLGCVFGFFFFGFFRFELGTASS